jgi:hypothetical protein
LIRALSDTLLRHWLGRIQAVQVSRHSELPEWSFPQTRRVTPDGVPSNCAKSDEILARKADKSFTKDQHVPGLGTAAPR